MKISKRKTKIVATVGPASSSPEIVEELIMSGVNVFRLNFSHGSHEEHGKVVKVIRKASKELMTHVAIFQDLRGPKVRIGDFVNGEVNLKDGEIIHLKYDDGSSGDEKTLYIESFDPLTVINPGEKVLLADGRIELISEKKHSDSVECKIVAGGILRSRSGIAVPESQLNLPSLSEKDYKDLEWVKTNDIDYIALSFVQSAADVSFLKEKLEEMKLDIPVIAKVERASCLEDISSIARTADAVMVARGDLGLELPLEEVPSAQKLIIKTSNFAGTPVITATQMLVSMVEEVRPTRAEVSDVFTAVRDGTDCVMLSEETAIGKHPVKAVKVLDRIIREAEKELDHIDTLPKLKSFDKEQVADAVCYAATGAANKIKASAILACTQSGSTARLIAKYRPKQLLFGATSQLKTLSRMTIYWGVIPVLIEFDESVGSDSESTEEEIRHAMFAVRDIYDIKPDSHVIVTAGLRTKKTGATNLMEVRAIPRADS